MDREPGWYPHPRYPDDERYWDGQLWGDSRPGGEDLRTPPTDRIRSLRVVLVFLGLMVTAYFGMWFVAAHTGDPTEPPAIAPASPHSP